MKEKRTEHLRFILTIFLVVIVILCGIGLSIFLNIKNKGVLGVITYNSSETFMGKEMQEKYDKKVLTTYTEYEEFIEENNLEEKLNSKDFKNKNFVIIILNLTGCSEKVNGIRNINYDKNNVKIKIGYDASCGLCAPRYEIYLIPIKKVNIDEVNYEYIKENNPDCDPLIDDKPLIYLYPTVETKVKVELLNPERLTTTYPKYEDSWEVIASPNGNLKDIKTQRNYYGLYWEGKYNNNEIHQDGFIVEGKNIAKFLEEKLSILGLNEREINEFIIYWLPKLESNKYNYIHFADIDEINNIMPLKVTPTPDTIIRILMIYKPLEEKIDIKPQKLAPKTRKGFTLIEWGGSEIK